MDVNRFKASSLSTIYYLPSVLIHFLPSAFSLLTLFFTFQ